MQNNKKLFLIDGMALIYRAYYAMIKNPLTSSTGLNTSAIYGFINSLLKLIKDENPDYITIVLDTKAKTFRHDKYDLYKANRKPMPEDLSEQLPFLYDILNSFNIKMFKKDGYEADDIIGAITRFKTSERIDFYMYSADKDLMQLINENTFLYSPGNNFKPTKIYEKDNVFEKCNIYPHQFVDYLALLGDASDNIPGVKGIGTKTASKLINKYGKLEKIYESLEQIQNPRIKSMLESNKENAFLSKELATIDVDVEIKFNLEELKIENLSYDKIVDKLNDLDIYTFDKELNKYNNNLNFSKIEKQYQIVDTYDKLDTFINNLKSKSNISLDLETTDINANIAEIVGIAISFEINTGFYIPLVYPNQKKKDFSKDTILKKIKPILELENLKIIGQNIKYDALILKRYNIELNNIYFDTMIAESLISPEKNNYKLDLLSKEYLSYNMMPIEKLIGEKKDQISMKDVPLEKIAFYACEDADVAFQIFLIQEKILKDENLDKLFYKVEIPLINVLVDIEYNGVFVDEKVLNKLCSTLKDELKIISDKIYTISDFEFNINSPKQLGEVLFDKLQLKMFKKRSTSVEVLRKLINHHPIADLILKYRHLSKLVNTYLDKLPNYINVKSNRIHTSFNQSITSTGRLSSTKPNFQNIPIKTDVGKSIRKAFSVQNKDSIILSFDYSQIELRILAHYSNEQKLIDAFENDLDIHTRTAALIYGIANDDVEYHHRRVAKIINYSIAYGAGPFRISEELKISMKEAKTIIDNYFNRYPGIKNYIENTVEQGEKKGYVTTFLGRRRKTMNLKSSNRNIREAEKRATINMPIQGTASELIKVAMISINRIMKEKKLKGKMILQIHDELLFEIPKYEKEEIIKLVRDEMVNAIKFNVPIKVDCNYGVNWFEAH